MSPIIYTPHDCAPGEDPDVAALGRNRAEGIIWQCPYCQSYWKLEITKNLGGKVIGFAWICIGRPQEQAHIREIQAALQDALRGDTHG